MRRARRMQVLVAVALAATVVEWAGAAFAEAQSWGWRERRPYASRRVRCESRHDRGTYCPTGTYGRVRIERRLSKALCREHITWGADPDGGGIWVVGGCRAVFVVTPWGGPGYGPPGPRPRPTLTCKSKGFEPNWCRLPYWGRVRLERRLSDAPCIEHRTWGVDGGGVWVDRGCAGVFSIR